MTAEAEERELRLALVMTGGVSLAVWMGGVAAEVYRLVRGEGLYRALLDLTGTRVVVDVISGSSAGGLNGAFLGTALSYDLAPERFDELRNLWFSAGSFTELLRNPKEKNPPSVLRGDDYFAPQVRSVLDRWVKDGTTPDPDNPLTVVLTAALLSPDLQTRTDVFGVSIIEPVHRARFTFRPEHFADSERLPGRLALAARTSASFPGAFEPSFVPIGPQDASASRPDMTGIASFSRSRWAVDGGVLMNKPVEPALGLIEARRARGEVRRVLAYVNPDPGTRREVVDLVEDMPKFAGVVVSSLVTLPRAESISSDLAEIAQYNERLLERRHTRDRLVWGQWTSALSDAPADPASVREELSSTADHVYALWVRRRVSRAVGSRLEGHLSRTGFSMGDRRSANGTGFTYGELLTALEEERLRTGWLPAEPPTRERLADGQWHHGFTPIEYLASVLLDLVRRSYDLLPAPADPEPEGPAIGLREELGEIRARIHDERSWLRALRSMDDDYYSYWLDHLDRLDVHLCAPDIAAAIYAQWPTPPLDLTSSPSEAAVVGPRPGSETPARDRDRRPRFGRSAAVSAAPDPDHDRAERLAIWRKVQALVRKEDERPSAAASRSRDEQLVDPRLDDPLRPLEPLLGFQFDELQDGMRAAELRIARRLAGAAVDLAGVIGSVVELRSPLVAQVEVKSDSECAPVPHLSEPLVLVQTAAVLTLGSAGSTDESGTGRPDQDDVVLTAADLFFVHSMVDEDAGGPETRIEFAQIAATAPNQLDPARTEPEQKVAGLQLGHFGGFVKESWRANDWMWGALDGAARLIPLLLDPVRLAQRFPSAAHAEIAMRRLATGRLTDAVTSDERAWLEREWISIRRTAVRQELQYLDPERKLPVPSSLPATTAAVTRLAQLLIAARELPEVRTAVENSTAAGADEGRDASIFVEKMKRLPMHDGRLALSSVPEAITSCRIGDERVASELGSDAGAAIATKAAAVLATAASGSRSGLGPLRHAAGAVRVSLLTIYYLALSAARRTKIGFALVTLLLAVGAGAIAARLLGGNVPDSVLVVAIVTLAFWVLLTGLTARSWGYAVGGVVLLGVIALSFIPNEAVCATFAESCGDAVTQPGWKGTVRWLIPVVLVVLAIVFAVVAARTNSKRKVRAARTGEQITAWRRVQAWLPAAFFLVIAVIYWRALHDALFTGDGQAGARGWAVDQLEGWSGANVFVILVGLPLLFILLGYVRQAFRDNRVDRARRRAYAKVDGSG